MEKFQVHFPIPSVLSTMSTKGQLDLSPCSGPDTELGWTLGSGIQCCCKFECCTRDGTVLQSWLDYPHEDTPHLLALMLPQSWVGRCSPAELNLPTVGREAPTPGLRCTRQDRIHSSDLGRNIIMNFTHFGIKFEF